MTSRDLLADLQAAIEELERRAPERLGAREYDEGLRELAAAFAARHGFSPPPEPYRARHLAPPLRFAIESGIMSEGQARDLDAFSDGLDARVAAGEITLEHAIDVAGSTAIRDAEAVVRARSGGNRAARRAEAAARRRVKR